MLSMRGDTIAAQATPAGEGGVAIVRMSGPQSAAILARVFKARGNAPLAPRVLTLGTLADPQHGEALDEAMAVFMPAPRSYTREDVAELHVHGSQALVRRTLLLLQREGARMAEPGEFTCRAFLNGRIDLAQAEGVMRMVRADSERAMRSALRQLEGGVSGYVKRAREAVTSLLAEISAAIDFPDEIEEETAREAVAARCRALGEALDAQCDPCAGRVEDEGLRVALCGRPNAGKSSLLNALLGGERAIVTDVPGTTRDTLTEALHIGGYRVILTDTAGLREAGDAVERLGVERARRAAREADVRLLALDGSVPPGDLSDLTPLAPQLVALTKADLPACLTAEEARAAFPGASVVPVCAPRGEGIARLCDALAGFCAQEGNESCALTQARHVEAARRACDALSDAARAAEGGLPLDMAAIDLSAALDALGEITGETLNEAVIDEVFSRFCVGK